MSEYKPSYMQEEDEEKTSTANPIQAPQNALASQAAPGSSTDQAAPAPSATSTSTEGGNLGVSSGTSAAPATANASKKSSGQFTNLQKFISANKGADLGGRIQGNIQKQTEQAKETLSKKAGEVGNVLAKQKTEREATFGNAATALDQVGKTKEVSATEQAPTSQVAQDLSQQEQTLTKAAGFKYGGPETFDISDVENQKATAESQAKATGSSSGRFGLLQEMFGRTGYTAGQQKLDNLLLQSDKDAQDKLAQARVSTRQFGREVEDTKQKTGQEITAEKTAAKNEIDTFANKLGTTSEALNQNLQDRIAAINPALEKDFANFTEEEKADVLTKLGFNRNSTGEFAIGKLDSVGVKELKDIFSQVKQDATISNLDKEQLARANLLQRIRGQSELGQFDENAGPFGVSKGISEPYADIAKYAPTGPETIASPTQAEKVAGSFRDSNSIGRLENLQIEKDLLRSNLLKKIQGQEMGGAVYGGITDPVEIKAAVTNHDMFKASSPQAQAKAIQRLDRGENIQGIINELSEAGAKGAAEAEAQFKAKDSAQKQALSDMAKYLRDSGSRDAFGQNWSTGDYKWRG